MEVKRVVANIAVDRTEDARRFYCDVLGLEIAMDLGWYMTLSSGADAPVQIGFATEGGIRNGGPGPFHRSGRCRYGVSPDARRRIRDRVFTDERTLGRSSVLRPRPLREAHQHTLPSLGAVEKAGPAWSNPHSSIGFDLPHRSEPTTVVIPAKAGIHFHPPMEPATRRHSLRADTVFRRCAATRLWPLPPVKSQNGFRLSPE